MTAPSFPRPPAGLTDTSKLPFGLWSVVELADGRRDVDTIARNVGISVPMVEEVLQRAEAYLNAPAAGAGRATPATQSLTDAVLDEVTRCLIASVGPMGDVMVDEALDEVGDDANLAELINALLQDMKEAAQAQFIQRLRQKGLA